MIHWSFLINLLQRRVFSYQTDNHALSNIQLWKSNNGNVNWTNDTSYIISTTKSIESSIWITPKIKITKKNSFSINKQDSHLQLTTPFLPSKSLWLTEIKFNFKIFFTFFCRKKVERWTEKWQRTSLERILCPYLNSNFSPFSLSILLNNFFTFCRKIYISKNTKKHTHSLFTKLSTLNL